MRFTAIAALLLAAVASAQSPILTNCAPGTTEMTVTSVSLSPYPLCTNKNVCITATGTLSTSIVAGASLSISGRYLGRVVYTDNQDLCNLLYVQGHPCPVPITVTSLTVCVLVKPTAPTSIPVVLTIKAINGNGNVLFCVTGTITAQNCP
ncbi:hypothetical protein BC939DRAFT_475820 [Gamsiella multidivaricata]|uniref:uncharacterized protein n=1 Tax=Gamsiella multidivaricata TaxID=101098 RepID=UPI0022207FE6|nr:uncharacterized protein BC939DRAFT_475820 [Gamsiella multidivaricata]KAI7826118.1 hypothetical protein BC939DRAFT_475820 [Gamsiella multidivaricata]